MKSTTPRLPQANLHRRDPGTPGRQLHDFPEEEVVEEVAETANQ